MLQPAKSAAQHQQLLAARCRVGIQTSSPRCTLGPPEVLCVDAVVHVFVPCLVCCTQQPQLRLPCQAAQLPAHALQVSQGVVQGLGKLCCIQLGC